MYKKALAHLQKDKILSKLIEELGPLPELEVDPNLFMALNKSIVSQQLSVKAADTIFGRFEDKIKGKFVPGHILTFNADELRSCGLSYRKAGYVHNISQYFIDNPSLVKDARNMSDDDLIEGLTSIKGVGVWTVQMLLIFALGRENIYPYDDLIVRKGTIHHYSLDPKDTKVKQKCFEIAEKWAPYRSIASRYMWASKDMMSL